MFWKGNCKRVCFTLLVVCWQGEGTSLFFFSSSLHHQSFHLIVSFLIRNYMFMIFRSSSVFSLQRALRHILFILRVALAWIQLKSIQMAGRVNETIVLLGKLNERTIKRYRSKTFCCLQRNWMFSFSVAALFSPKVNFRCMLYAIYTFWNAEVLQI